MSDTLETPPAEAAPVPDAGEPLPEVQGFFDGYRGAAFEGWAWRPAEPDTPVVVEVYANGFRLGEAEASIYRPDLRAAGVGHGRFGFSLPFAIDPDRPDPVQVSVRVKDGPPLTDGETTLGGAEPLNEGDAEAFGAFVAAVLGRPAPPREAEAPEPAARTHVLVYCPTGPEVRADILGVAEYSYTFVLKAFLPVLERFGEVHWIDDPARQADLLHGHHLLAGETSLMLSFAPPHRTTLNLRCPVVPVIAWEYPTVPAEVWEDERRHDWSWVLRQTGRAITLSGLAARAIKAQMGADFPAVAVPSPVWDRSPDLHGLPLRPPEAAAEVELEGFVLDTRAFRFGPDMVVPRPPGPEETSGRARLEGVVFTSVFAPKDGRKNWPDLVTAFLAALGEREDATLVLKMVGRDVDHWWWDLFERLSRAPRFRCRILVLHGYLDEARYAGLIGATHWVVNSSNAEGQCLPLMEFMCAGRPAIAPVHTAMADYFDAGCGLVVHSDEQYCGWPHDTRMGMTTTRHQVSWSSLREAFAEGYRLAKDEPERLRTLGGAAAERMRAYCSDAVVADRLSGFLGLGRLSARPRSASALLAGEPPA